MKNAPLLSVNNLSVSFHRGKETIPVVKGIQFEIHAGSTVSIVGESGSGKTVTALSILQLLPYPQAFHPGGEIWFQEKNILQMPKKALQRLRGKDIAMIFQEPMTSLNPLHTIEKQISETLILHQGMDTHHAREHCLELLDQVELSQLKQRLHAYPHELSGGQRQRVMIAMALANNPKLLIADEPTTALDVTIQSHIFRLLQSLQKQRNMALLLITHDLTLVRRVSDHVLVMHKGDLVEKNTTPLLFAKPAHPYTQHLLSSEPKGHPLPIVQGASEVLHASGITVSFPLRKNFFGKTLTYLHAVDHAQISLREGGTLGIVGESGSGKTTLALALLRLIPSKGTIIFQGKPIHMLQGPPLRHLRKSLQIVFQDPFGSLNPRLSIFHIIEEGLRAHRLIASAKERDKKVCAILEEVGLDPATRYRYPHELSGGQRQRVAIARGLILNPVLMVLDEPTSALDLSVQSQIIELLRSLQQKHRLAYIFISHDLRVIKAMSHTIVVMQNGKIIETNTAQQLFTSPIHAYTRTLIEAAFPAAGVGGLRQEQRSAMQEHV